MPGAPLDNNICERALKKAILHRKNALFYKTENGARVGDLFMSLIHTAELNDVNPFDYLVAAPAPRHPAQGEPGPVDALELPRHARRSAHRSRSAALTTGGSAGSHPSDPSLGLGGLTGNRSQHRKIELCTLTEKTQFTGEFINPVSPRFCEPTRRLVTKLGFDAPLRKFTDLTTPLGKEGRVVRRDDQHLLIAPAKIIDGRAVLHRFEYRERCAERNVGLSHADLVCEDLELPAAIRPRMEQALEQCVYRRFLTSRIAGILDARVIETEIKLLRPSDHPVATCPK